MNWNKVKRLLTLTLAAAMLLTAAGCGNQDGTADETDETDGETVSSAVKTGDGRFTLGYDADYTLDPIATTSTANALVDSLVYEFAVEVDQSFQAEPNLITSWSTDNGYSWIFQVDTSVKFHDGSSLTASDVAHSINRARQSKTYGTRLNKILGVTTMNTEQFMVTLSDTDNLFPRLLSIPVIKEGGEGLPQGTGPYVFAADLSKLTAYSDYRDSETAPVDTIYLHQNGDADQTISDYSSALIDLVVNDPTGLSRLGYGSNNEIRYFNTTNLQFVGMNLRREFICYRDMRAALSYAVDRSYIVDTVLSGSAEKTVFPIHPASELYPAELAKNYQYDLDTCRTLLHAAGVEDYDNDGMLEYQLANGAADINLKFVVCSDNTDKVRSAQKIAADLESIGIGVTVKELSWDDYIAAIQAGNYDLFYGEIKLPADFNLTDMLTTNGLQNYYGIDSAEYYSFIHSYLEADEENRQQACTDMCQFLADNGPIIPVCFEKQQVLTHRDVVSGAAPTQYNVFYQLKNWSINLDNA